MGWISGLLGIGGSWIGSKLGADIDRDSSIDQYTDRYNFLRSEGATMTEAMGNSSGGTASGATSTLGNQFSAQTQKLADYRFQAQENEKDRQVQRSQQQTQLATAQLGANAQTTSAGISAGAQRYVADLQAAVNRENLSLQSRQFLQIALPKAAAELGISAQQLLKLTNEVSLSNPEFVMRKLMLSMGSENLKASLAAMNFNIDFNDPEAIKALTPTEMHNIVVYMAGIGSSGFAEVSGVSVNLQTGFEGASNWFSKIFGGN